MAMAMAMTCNMPSLSRASYLGCFVVVYRKILSVLEKRMPNESLLTLSSNFFFLSLHHITINTPKDICSEY
jgi:hypothetical protein